ncbi:hypothetical protein HK405_009990 [Cladochytrium tenue]|nr:hypothetical protein HK405_009990 [Cladochytrium tenue]
MPPSAAKPNVGGAGAAAAIAGAAAALALLASSSCGTVVSASPVNLHLGSSASNPRLLSGHAERTPSRHARGAEPILACPDGWQARGNSCRKSSTLCRPGLLACGSTCYHCSQYGCSGGKLTEGDSCDQLSVGSYAAHVHAGTSSPPKRIAAGPVVFPAALAVNAAGVSVNDGSCPSPLLSCGAACYSCDNYGCSNDQLTQGNSCGGSSTDSSSSSTDSSSSSSSSTCPSPLLSCGTACYSCDNYGCSNGELTQGNSCSAGTSSDSTSGSDTSSSDTGSSDSTGDTSGATSGDSGSSDTSASSDTGTTTTSTAGSGTSVTGSVSNSSGRVMTFVNNCDVQITVQITAGSTAYASGASTCSSDSDCAAGGACNTVNGVCYAIVPALDNGGVLAAGASTAVTYPYYGDNSVVFSGNVIACFGAACRASFGGTTNPATRAEFTLATASSDYYDVSIIDGFNLPMEMAAVGGTADASNPYWCGNPGSQSPVTSGMGSCSWSASPPAQYYVAVSDTEGSQASCSSSSDCTTAGEACGAPIDGATSASLRCAPLYGYFHPPRSCEVAGTCSNAAGAVTLSDLFMCDAGLASCYSSGATTACCGCQNWGDLGLTVPSATQTCVSVNPDWTSGVLPSLQWLKTLCPSVYTFPFDDMSSTFTCSSGDSGTTNEVGYTITMCPQSAKLAAGSTSI